MTPEQCHLQVTVVIEFLLLLGIPKDVYTGKQKRKLNQLSGHINKYVNNKYLCGPYETAVLWVKEQ